MKTNPFSRFKAVMAVMFAAMSKGMGAVAALESAGGYTSRGKGEGKPNRLRLGANGAFKRAAKKARNVAKQRKVCRG